MTQNKSIYELITNPILAIILAGGRGTRLRVLTEDRCKPEVPVGKNHFIDFTMANVVNSRIIDHTMILTQYKQQGLAEHLNRYDLNSHLWQKFVDIVPPQQALGDESWYVGSANAVYQNHRSIRNDPAKTVVILAADHIYKLDIRQMLAYHFEKNAVFTVCGMIMPVEEAAGNFGVMELDEDFRILGFEEKPVKPKEVPGRPGYCFASMGIYISDKGALLDMLEEDYGYPGSKHDFGGDIVPALCRKGAEIFGYDYNTNNVPGEVRMIDGVQQQIHYWRDVGKIGPYWESVMDLVSVDPYLNLYNPLWPVPTAWDRLPPAKFIFPDKERYEKSFGGTEFDERFLPDVITAGGSIFDSPQRLSKAVFCRQVRTWFGVNICYSVVFDRATIGSLAHLQYTIVEEGVEVPTGARCGFDLKEDAANGVYIDEEHDERSGHPPIRVITKSTHWKGMQ